MARLLVALMLVVAACGGTGSEPAPLLSTPDAAWSPPVVEVSPDPTDTPPPTPKPLAVKVTKVTKSVVPGNRASVTVKTQKKAKCSIEVEYESGPSTARGLGDKKANADGVVKWTWLVGFNTNRQEAGVYIFCTLGDRSGSAETSVNVK